MTDAELLAVFEEQMTVLLRSLGPGVCAIDCDDFLNYYQRHYGHVLRLEDFGVVSVRELVEKIPEVAQVKIKWSKLYAYIYNLFTKKLLF